MLRNGKPHFISQQAQLFYSSHPGTLYSASVALRAVRTREIELPRQTSALSSRAVDTLRRKIELTSSTLSTFAHTYSGFPLGGAMSVPSAVMSVHAAEQARSTTTAPAFPDELPVTFTTVQTTVC